MDLIFKIILIIHIICGSAGLFTGTINIARKKGDKPHFLVGKIFFISMVINAIAGFVMSIMHENLFLLIIAVFSFYMVSTGQRILALKNLLQNQKPKIIDYCLTIWMLLFGIGFIIYGIFMLVNINSFGLVLLIFGLISLFFVRTDFRLFKGLTKYKNYWLIVHLQRMIGGYIASVTAFIVTVDKFNLGIVGWLLPTVILVPLIVKWSRKYQIQ